MTNRNKALVIRKCVECKREFDMLNEVDADEWLYGHDCES